MLVLSRKPEETILGEFTFQYEDGGKTVTVTEPIEILIVEVRGNKVRIGLKASKNVRFIRKELVETESVETDGRSLRKSRSVTGAGTTAGARAGS